MKYHDPFTNNISFIHIPLKSFSRSSGWFLYDGSNGHKLVNPFVPNALFLHLLKTTENFTVFDVFRGYRKCALGTNGLKTINLINPF